MPSSPNGPCSTGKATSASSRPPPARKLDLLAIAGPASIALEQDTDHLVARRPQAVGHRGARVERDLVLARTAAAEHRDPHQGVGVVVVVVDVVGGAMNLPTKMVTNSPRRRRVPALGD